MFLLHNGALWDMGEMHFGICEMHNILISLFHCFSWSGIILCMPPSQWETSLHCNVISHCLGPYTKWSLHDAPTSHSHFLYYVNPRCHHNCNTAMQHVSPSHYPQLCKYLFACYESHNPSPEEMLWSNYIKGIIIHWRWSWGLHHMKTISALLAFV